MSSRFALTTAIIGVASLISGTDAFFRLPCASPVVVERADPIVSPGEVSSHVHTVMGSNAFNFSMSYDDTQAATCSTCKVKQDMSSYWVPNLYYHAQNGSFVPVPQSGGALIYYLQRTDPADPEPGLVAFPEDFRMIAGTPTARNDTNTTDQAAVSFVCLGVTGPATPELPRQNCPDGLRTQLTFPSCWDGENLDSLDHKAHVAYPSGLDHGACASSHPKRFITIFYEVTWSVDAFKDMWYGDSQPFVFSHGDPTGYGYHGDFLNGWDVPTLQKAIDTCDDNSGVIENCDAFQLRSDSEISACKVLPRVDEAVDGVLAALPGCNPIQAGPEAAVMDKSCNAPSQIGDPQLPFTDASQSLHWRYVACAQDPAGQSRTLDGPNLDQQNMTVNGCIQYCDSQGYSHAGLEYKTQCFCGNSVAQDRMPQNGTMGSCQYKCAGDATQICGGYAEVSVYEKCQDEECKNADLGYP